MSVFSLDIAKIFMLMNKEVKCYIQDCDREADYKIVIKQSNNSSILFLCSFHLNKLIHGE